MRTAAIQMIAAGQTPSSRLNQTPHHVMGRNIYRPIVTRIGERL
ncbi:hypothetical protein HNR39_004285, partial [Glaciimonas immobilis]|nr:hypothetical protein [Glaciimonas immobilis]